MSEGRELACALHFQLEAAIQIVGALGGCILVARILGDPTSSSSDGALQKQLTRNQNLGLRADGTEPAASHSGNDDQGTVVDDDYDDEDEDAQEAEGQGGDEEVLISNPPGGSFAFDAPGQPPQRQVSFNRRDHAPPSANSLRAGRPPTTAGVAPPRPPQSLHPVQQYLAAQFRCVALSGKTQHKAFSHESMLTGAMESRMALNIALAGEPLLVVPLTHPVNPNEACVGVLCLAYKAHPEILQFDERDEAHAYVAAGMIAMTLQRCHAARYVEPYRVCRLEPLGLQSSSTFAPMPLWSGAAREGGNSAATAAQNSSTGRGMVYRSSSRAALAKKITALQGEVMPSLPSLMEISHVIKELDALLLRQQDSMNRQQETQHALERRLRSLQQEYSLTKITADRDKREGEAFRLSGTLAEARLRERIAKSEVQKMHHAEVSKNVNEEVLEFLQKAKAAISALPHQSGGKGGGGAVGGRGNTTDHLISSFRGRPCPPPLPPARMTHSATRPSPRSHD